MIAARTERLRLGITLDKIIMVVAVIVVFWLVTGPLSMLVFASLRSTEDKLPFEATSFTLSNYLRVIASPASYTLFLNTLWYAVGSLGLGLGLAIVLSWLLERTNVPLRAMLMVLVLSPMAVPGVVKGMAWVLLANPSNGILNNLIRDALGFQGHGPLNIYSIPGMIFVTGLTVIPSMYVMISGIFSRMDPALEEASEVSGAGRWSTWRRVTMPLLAPGLLAAAVYYFVFLIEIFEIPALLGMTQGVFVFSTLIYDAVHPFVGLPDFGLASGYAMVYLLVALALIYLYLRTVRRGERFQVVTGRGYRPRLIDLGRWRYLCAAGVFAYALVSLILPFSVIMWASLLRFYSSPALEALAGLTLDNYLRILQAPGMDRAVANSLIVATATATITMVLATVVAWLAVRGSFRGSSLPDVMTFAILGVPGVVIGLALVFLYLSLPLPIYGTVWIIVIGLSTRFLTFGTRVMRSAITQIGRELEEAASTSGAPGWLAVGRILLPLASPSLLRGWLWIFVQGFRDVTIPLMLMAPASETIAARLFLAWVVDGDIVFASALAMPLVAVSAILTFLMARWTLLGARDAAAI